MSGIIVAMSSVYKPAVGGGGTPAFVGFVNSAASDESTKTATRTVTSGNLIVAAVIWADASTTCTIDDNNTNSWTQIGTTTNQGADMFIQFWYSKNAHAGSTTVSAHLGASRFACLGIWEASGCSTSAPLDGSGGTAAQASGTAITTSTTATSQAVEFEVAAIGNFGGNEVASQAGWTEDFDTGDFAQFQHFITASSGTHNGFGSFSGGSSQASVAVFGAFK